MRGYALITYPATMWLGSGPGWDARVMPKHDTFFAPFRGFRVWPRLERSTATTGVRAVTTVWLPLWIPGVVLAGSALLLGWRLHRTRSRPHNRCVCGYDLSATPQISRDGQDAPANESAP